MHVGVGLIFMAVSAIGYTVGVNLVSYFYHRSFGPMKPREPIWQIGLQYTAIVSWCLQERTMPKWVPKLVEWSTFGFIFGAFWSLIAVFV